jgi:hypothetical protein
MNFYICIFGIIFVFLGGIIVLFEVLFVFLGGKTVGPFLYFLGFFWGDFCLFWGKKSEGIFVFFGGIFVFSGLVFNMILLKIMDTFFLNLKIVSLCTLNDRIYF